jgi:hypothetical protein
VTTTAAANGTYRSSVRDVGRARTTIESTGSLGAENRAVAHEHFTAGDLYYADVANGLALRDLPTPSRRTTTAALGIFSAVSAPTDPAPAGAPRDGDPS